MLVFFGALDTMTRVLKDSVITELKAEASRLREQARLIDAFLQGVVDERNGQGVEAGVIHGSHELPMIEVDGSLAANVRTALRLIGKTTTSLHVATRLVSLGLSDTRNGKPLKSLVAVELFRQSKKPSGPVRKKGRGRYRYVETDASDEG